MKTTKLYRYGFGDLTLSKKTELPKYQKVYDMDGVEIGEIECYFIGTENMEQ